MIARSVTIVAPIVNEWDPPFPILMMTGFSIIGLITSYTFDDISDSDPETILLKLKEDEDSQVTYHNISNKFDAQEVNNFDDELVYKKKSEEQQSVKSTGLTNNTS